MHSGLSDCMHTYGISRDIYKYHVPSPGNISIIPRLLSWVVDYGL